MNFEGFFSSVLWINEGSRWWQWWTWVKGARLFGQVTRVEGQISPIDTPSVATLTHTPARTDTEPKCVRPAQFSQRLWLQLIWESSTSGALTFHCEVKGGGGICVRECVNEGQRGKDRQGRTKRKSSLSWADCKRESVRGKGHKLHYIEEFHLNLFF